MNWELDSQLLAAVAWAASQTGESVEQWLRYAVLLRLGSTRGLPTVLYPHDIDRLQHEVDYSPEPWTQVAP